MRLALLLALMLMLDINASAQETYMKAGIHDHIAVDAGIYMPVGSVATELGLSGSVGFGIHFWRALSEDVIAVASVGNIFMPLGTNVQTDSGRIDLSGYTVNITPLLGGLGYVYTYKDLHPFLILLGGAQFVTLELSKNRPAEEFQNQAYFTLGGSAGVSYALNHWLSIITTVRYLHMFDADMHHYDITMGASFAL